MTSYAAAATSGNFLQSNLLTVVLVLVFAVMIIFMFRNSRKRRRDQEEMKSKLVPGTEVMTTHGIYGRIISIDEDKNEAVIETTPGTRLRLHSQTLSRVVEPTVADPASESADGSTVPDDASSLTGDADARPSYELNPDSSASTAAPEYGERTTPSKPKRTPRDTAAKDEPTE